MSAIAYITDSKLLELHRLNAHKTMNFWRLSTKNSFSDFGKDDLVFFLSKDKELMKKKEKGIVGFGKLDSIYSYAPKTMWNKFGKENGYNSYKEFIEAIEKVSKGHELPKKISSFYLKNVVFFQAPIYLSELNINISNKVESYVYIKPEESVIKLLEYGKDAVDMWSGDDELVNLIDDEQLAYSIKLAHKEIGDFNLDERKLKSANRTMKKLIEKNPGSMFIGKSKLDVSYINKKDVLIVLYHDKDLDYRLLVGQAQLYKKYIRTYYHGAYKIYFKTCDNNKKIIELINNV
ncbi:MAG: hypothetical protein IJH31_00650 [Erysipelotrichaceae bacterium]|nr:hypothetical protein [Erysipelotrichaceae bacterium]